LKPSHWRSSRRTATKASGGNTSSKGFSGRSTASAEDGREHYSRIHWNSLAEGLALSTQSTASFKSLFRWQSRLLISEEYRKGHHKRCRVVPQVYWVCLANLLCNLRSKILEHIYRVYLNLVSLFTVRRCSSSLILKIIWQIRDIVGPSTPPSPGGQA
jgi:hypothetical protein